jgi:lipoyl synthase
MGLRYVVITSVDRDDLRDGGAQHFADCIRCHPQAVAGRTARNPGAGLPRPHGRCAGNHRPPSRQTCSTTTSKPCRACIKAARPGSDYQWSLTLLQRFKQMMPHIPTKSGLMLGLGETDEEMIEVMKRMREHGVTC